MTDHDFPPAEADDDVPAPNPYAPRKDASQRAAAAKRALGPAPDAPPVVRASPLVAYGAGAVIALLIGMMSYQLGTGARPLQLPAPTSAPTATNERAREAPSAPFSATSVAPVYDFATPTPTAIPLAVPVVAPIRYDEPAPPVVEPAPQEDFYAATPQVDPAWQQSLVGSDPNALACNGSPLCGGLTNAEAQAALDSQRATAAAR